MKAVDFEGRNVLVAEDQEEYETLPACTDGRQTVSCWELSAEEIEKVKETGKVWLSQFNSGQALQPILLTVNREDVLAKGETEQG